SWLPECSGATVQPLTARGPPPPPQGVRPPRPEVPLVGCWLPGPLRTLTAVDGLAMGWLWGADRAWSTVAAEDWGATGGSVGEVGLAIVVMATPEAGDAPSKAPAMPALTPIAPTMAARALAVTRRGRTLLARCAPDTGPPPGRLASRRAERGRARGRRRAASGGRSPAARSRWAAAVPVRTRERRLPLSTTKVSRACPNCSAIR